MSLYFIYGVLNSTVLIHMQIFATLSSPLGVCAAYTADFPFSGNTLLGNAATVVLAET